MSCRRLGVACECDIQRACCGAKISSIEIELFAFCHVIDCRWTAVLSSHDSHHHEAKHGLIAAAAHTNNGLFLSTRIKAGTIGRRQAATNQKKQSLGQNFLVGVNLAKRIATSVAPAARTAIA